MKTNAPRSYHHKFREVVIPKNCHFLVRKLLEEINEKKIPLIYVSEVAGVGKWTIGAWARGYQSPTIQNLEACYQVVGLRLHAMPSHDD